MNVKIGPTGTKTPTERPLGAPNTSSRRPQNVLRAILSSKKQANDAQGSSKSNLEALFGRCRAPKEPPRDPQELPKGAQESPQTVSKPSLDLNRCFFINAKIPKGKSRFFRVGGSACELTIDAKRHRKKIKYDIEERKTKINEKKQPEASKRGPRKFPDESGSPLWSM